MNWAKDSQPRGGFSTPCRTCNDPPVTRALLIAALLVAGCGRAAPGNTADPAQAAPQPAAPAAAPVAVEEKTDLLEFHYGWPAVVSAIPALADSLRKRALDHKAELLKTAASDKAERAKSNYPFNAYESSIQYEAAGATTRLLSLSADWFDFTGGAHPNHGTKALLWDKTAAKEVKFADLLSGGQAQLSSLYAKAYCDALQAQRAKKREGEPVGDPDDGFNKCPGFDELSIIPKAAAAGAPFGTLWFHADPYVAGPYVEGDYDVELPVNAALVAALKPEDRASFAAR